MRYVNPRRFHQWKWAVAGLLLGLMFGVMTEWSIVAIIPTCLAVVALAVELARRIKEKNDFVRGPVAGSETIWRFTDNGIEIHTGENRGEVPWKNILLLDTTPLGLVVFPHPKQFQLVPTDAFQSKDEVEEVMAMFNQAKEETES